MAAVARASEGWNFAGSAVTASLPAAVGRTGQWAWDTTLNKPVYSDGTSWLELVAGVDFVTPFMFKGKGDGVADDTVPLAKAAATGKCLLPSGSNWLTTLPVRPPVGGVFKGQGRRSIITGAGVTGGVVEAGYSGSGFMRGVQVGNFTIAGSATNALRAENAIAGSVFDRIWLGSSSFTDAFYFVNDVFGNTISNLITDGYNPTNSCFRTGNGFNANFCPNWYSSSFSAYNLLMNGGGYGNRLFVTAQGGRIGAYIGGGYRNTEINIYTENVVRPIVLGDVGAGELCVGAIINAGQLGGPDSSHPNYADRVAVIDFNYAISCLVNAPDFSGSYGIGLLAPLTFSGGAGAGAQAIARVKPNGVISSVLIVNGGTGYTGDPTVAVGGAGASASITATRTAGVVTGLTIVNAGTGYGGAALPPWTQRLASKCTIKNLFFNDGVNGLQSSAWPWSVRSASADSTTGVCVENDLAYPVVGAGTQPLGDLKRVDGYGYQHYFYSLDSSGVQVKTSFVPAAYP